ncbi:MBL fold metallo-hydrolase [Hoyosella sp. YIM 151337]|uniref:MBL fold metallo-hydrolase n=1 Tax=Hoyosella sp. YIM 151337 TaxID=2992742 RepID=UPI002235D413|nr:MBL fold metallo-hydrolase [Hoyosella sp. YIM 151337]MCW4353884.1 MBL fold metallo-hydrolase [Hoyosella sp. YIM 151337]
MAHTNTPVHLGNDVYLIDTLMAGLPGINAAYAILSEAPCLVETGTSLTADTVRDGLAALGVGRADLAAIVVTHIHLDHAGAVGHLAEQFPNAQIWVHERGARHLADPSRLMVGAQHVYGDVLARVFGFMRPADHTRVHVLGDGEKVDLGGGRYLTGHHTPGHAKHHLGLQDSLTGDVFAGDAAGIYIPEIDLLKPATPPSDFDLDSALESLRLLVSLRPQRLLYTHFGPADGVADKLAVAAEELQIWVEVARRAHAEQQSVDHAVAMVMEATRQRYARLHAAPSVEEKFDRLLPPAMNVEGIYQWLDKAERG